MNTFEKLKAKRSALRGSITKFMAKTESILDSSVEDTDSDEILELLEHINKKENDLNIVNSEIEIAITDPTVFDNEFKRSEEYSDKITIIKFRIKNRIKRINDLYNSVAEKRENRPSQSEREPNSQSEQQENEIFVGTSHSPCSNSTILQTCTVLASSENKTLNIRILLDSGSERTFILREVAEALNLKPIRKERLLLYSFGKKNPEPSNFDLVQLQLKNPHNPKHRIPIEALITQHISGASLDSRFLVNKIKMLAEVSGLEPADSGKGKIQLLLGMDFFCEVIRGAPVRITKGLFAQKSLFGNIICGALPNMTSNKSSACFGVSVEDDLNQHLRTLWEIESIGCDTAQETKHDSEFIKEFENNLTFADGRCETKLLWNLPKTHLKQLAEFEKKKEERQARPLENQRAEALRQDLTEPMLERENSGKQGPQEDLEYLEGQKLTEQQKADEMRSKDLTGRDIFIGEKRDAELEELSEDDSLNLPNHLRKLGDAKDILNDEKEEADLTGRRKLEERLPEQESAMNQTSILYFHRRDSHLDSWKERRGQRVR
ncbi:DUF1758 domain-containing protein [Nephila pilipes]|uniref:DUF1758 domain-containing protein n=1 Tax=Nephila pilipes TaxID=299642 RepID=A0A8X6UL88_NEPPI|nr:DUF1758 domain-containing protein [Nephila pilipes]